MTVKKRFTKQDVLQWVGQPVCVVLKNGSCYMGYITKVNNGSFRFAGTKERKGMTRSSFRRAGRARVSGLFPLTNGLGFGGGGLNPFGMNPGFGGQAPGLAQNGQGVGGLGGLGGFMGMFKKYWPGIQMGLGMVKTIMPLLGGLKI